MEVIFPQIDTGVTEDDKPQPDSVTSMETDPSPATQPPQQGMGQATQPSQHGGLGQANQPSQQGGLGQTISPASQSQDPSVSAVPALQSQGGMLSQFPGGFSTNVLPPPGSQPPQVGYVFYDLTFFSFFLSKHSADLSRVK